MALLVPQPIPQPTTGAGVPDPGVRPTAAPNAPSTPQTQERTTGLAGAAGGALDALNPFSDLTDSLTAVRAWTSNRHNWVRVAWVLGGGSMFAIGVLMLAGRPATSAAMTVLPVGKAVKAAGAIGKAAS